MKPGLSGASGADGAAGTTACAGHSSFEQLIEAPPQDQFSSLLKVTAGQTLSFCLPFEYVSTNPPTSLIYGSVKPPISWPMTYPGPGSTTKPVVLASFTGSGSKLLTMPAAVTNATGLKIAWSMPSSGNNIIQAESDTAGSDLMLITNVVGANTNSKVETAGGFPPYLQVLSEGSWSITITNF